MPVLWAADASIDQTVGSESPKEACGLFGVWAPGEDVARLTFFGLFALQHRGQESAGMALADGQRIVVYRELGLVSQVFNEVTLSTLQGDLAIGRLPGGGWCVASETCALDVVGAAYVREVQPGELVAIDERGVRSRRFDEHPTPKLCLFEFVYLGRADSRMYGRSLHEARREMGRRLAREAPADADLVIPIPDTGHSAAEGYAEVARIPFGEGLMKNRYIGRTFIEPTPALRARGVRLKLNPLPETIQGKRLVVVDDSIVRGTTTRQIVQVLRDAGAAEVHLRIVSPPIRWPCFYGIDMSTREELIAANHRVEEIRDFVGADSLAYISLQGLVEATR